MSTKLFIAVANMLAYRVCLTGSETPTDIDVQKLVKAVKEVMGDVELSQLSAPRIRLLMGDFARGWPEYRWRHKLQACQTKPIVSARPYWTGESLEG